ncbi:MAG: hypothetical protein HQ541_05020 [Mariniphaga sp.]|nr:hypothetical protein [Mariniphaga sp.]
MQSKGANIKDNSKLNKWAKRKTITQNIVLNLIDIAKPKGDEEMISSRCHMFRCFNNIVVSGERVYGYFCGGRICTTCMAIRKAKMINKYFPEIQKWGQPFLLTLTSKSCYARNLNSRM